MFGPPKVYSGQTPEHCLSPMVKWAARHTQLRPSSLIEQSCVRYYENLIIDRAYDMLQYQNVINKKNKEPKFIEFLKQRSKDTSEKSYIPIGRYKIILSKEYKYLYIQSSQSKKCNKEILQSSNIIQSVI